jgi:hypothetical protein
MGGARTRSGLGARIPREIWKTSYSVMKGCYGRDQREAGAFEQADRALFLDEVVMEPTSR